MSGMAQFRDRLGVCSWSLQPSSPRELAERMKAVGLSRVQLALDPLRLEPAVWGDAAQVLGRAGIEIVSGMFGCEGEDYSTLESIRRTGGVVPDATWDRNWANAQATAELAGRLGVKTVTFHAGFLPHDPQDPSFGKLVGRVRQIARCFATRGIVLNCETGQETAPALKAFLEHLNEPNVGVNFDPANMILYGNGDPVPALRMVGKWVKGVHVKDAVATKTPGTWGTEVVVGTGEVNWKAFFSTLAEIGFGGWLCLEREAGSQRVEDLRAGYRFARETLSALG